MDPNQPAPEPIQPEIPTQPVAPPNSPTVQPVVDSFQPFQPVESPVVQPVVETQPVEQSELTGAPTQQQFAQPINTVSIPRPKKSKAKLFIIITLIVVVLVGAGVATWLMFFNGLALKQYSNDQYSILVPSSYVKEEEGETVTFKKPDTKTGYESQVSIMYTDIPDDQRDEFVTEMDKQFTKESVESGGSIIGYQETSNVEFNKYTKNGVNARSISGNVIKNKEITGKFKMTMYYTEKRAYFVLVGAHVSEPKLSASTDKILDSIKFK